MWIYTCHLIWPWLNRRNSFSFIVLDCYLFYQHKYYNDSKTTRKRNLFFRLTSKQIKKQFSKSENKFENHNLSSFTHFDYFENPCRALYAQPAEKSSARNWTGGWWRACALHCSAVVRLYRRICSQHSHNVCLSFIFHTFNAQVAPKQFQFHPSK